MKAGARAVVLTWVGTRAMMLALALWLQRGQGRVLADSFGNWDVAHYLAIAKDGYANPADIAFFPGWPLLIRLSSLSGLSPLLVGTILALIASGFAAAALHRLAGAPAAIAWLVAPTAVFTLVPYSEALFCAVAFWAWERATAKRWAAVGVLAALAASVRVSGVFLVVALGVLALTQPGSAGERRKRMLWLALPAAVIGGYLGYLYLLTGSWTAWYQAQATGWSRSFTLPWEALRHTLEVLVPGAYPDHPEWAWVFAAELVSMLVGVAITLVALFRRRWAEATWVGLQVGAFSVSYWFMSVNRAVLLWFPLWAELGRLGRRRGRMRPGRAVLIVLLVILALFVQAAWAWLFFTGRWAS